MGLRPGARGRSGGGHAFAVAHQGFDAPAGFFLDVGVHSYPSGFQDHQDRRAAELEMAFFRAPAAGPALGLLLDDGAHHEGAHFHLDQGAVAGALDEAPLAVVGGQDVLLVLQGQGTTR
jgi:hypothetical protein